MGNYTIHSGDTLWALARRFGTTISKLAQANHIANPNLIITGRTLKVPDSFDSTPASKPRPAHPQTTPAASTAQTASPAHTASTAQVAAHGPVPSGTAAKYDFYKKQILAHGGKFNSRPGHMNLIGFRTQTNTHANGGQGRYDDKLVAVWMDRHHQPHVREYKYNTEPAYAMRSYSSDVTGDGVPDQGRVPAGYHEYAQSSWKHGFCLRATSDFSVQRDYNHDGRFTETRRTGGGASMLFHQGGSYGTYSAGCQTFPPSEWSRFVNDMRSTGGSIGYTLVNR